jgi:hypothetical protein
MIFTQLLQASPGLEAANIRRFLSDLGAMTILVNKKKPGLWGFLGGRAPGFSEMTEAAGNASTSRELRPHAKVP